MDTINLLDRTIEMEPLKQQSSSIKDIGYDADGRLLVIRFKSGSVYYYTPILPQAYRALLDSDSVGSYLQRNIVKNILVKTVKLEAK